MNRSDLRFGRAVEIQRRELALYCSAGLAVLPGGAQGGLRRASLRCEARVEQRWVGLPGAEI
jgi:hypothetical protein